MSKTIRWYHKICNIVKLNIKHRNTDYNPYWFKHELKLVRVKIHRQIRRNNKIKLQKGFDIEKEHKTNGWETW